MIFEHKHLKTRQRNEREGHPPNLALRVHRALSWLDRAEQSDDDQDAQFIFLWIAFNAAYGNDVDSQYRQSEQETFRGFIERLCDLDKESLLADLVWNEFTSSIRVLLQNKYVFQPFWEYQNGNKTAQEWQDEFATANAFANKALGFKNTSAVLSVIFSRLYTLRNQTMHGGATWNSSANRDQIRDAVAFLSQFVPIAIKVMMDNVTEIWGDPSYPMIKD